MSPHALQLHEPNPNGASEPWPTMRPVLLVLPQASIGLALPSLLDSILSSVPARTLDATISPAPMLPSSSIKPITEASTGSFNDTQWSTTTTPPTTVSLNGLLTSMGIIGRPSESIRTGSKYTVSVSVDEGLRQPWHQHENRTTTPAHVETQTESGPLWMSFLAFYTVDKLQPIDVLVHYTLSKSAPPLFASIERIWRNLSNLFTYHGPEIVAVCIFIIIPFFLLIANSVEDIWTWFIPEKFPERGRERVRLDAEERSPRLWAKYERETVVMERYGDCWWRQARRFRR